VVAAREMLAPEGPVVGVEHYVVDPEPAQRIVGESWRQLSESGPECRRA
jgi:hypothetical protein